MRRAVAEVATVLQQLDNAVEHLGLNTHQLRHLRALKDCRTAALGGHVDACTDCGVVHISYYSCRNRHCPTSHGHKRESWMQKRTEELLPVPYFHVVFTLPGELNALCMLHPKLCYDTLFAAAWQTLQAFGTKQNLQMGMIAILHTWGQNLSLHPHLHCIVPGGGVDPNSSFKPIRADGKYLFSVKAMGKIFRAKYVAGLRENGVKDKALFDALFSKNWVVYAKRPFGNVHSVIEYLGRYTHKVAISNSRIKEVSKTHTSFELKDYKQDGKKQILRLKNAAFVRRFAQHILPQRFVRIRHYGILSSTWKRKKLAQLQRQMNVQIIKAEPQTKLRCCPDCKKPTLITIAIFGNKGPPKMYLLETPSVPAM
ncbi:MAG: IS91 family transposase [Oscillospiraceae bacterium]